MFVCSYYAKFIISEITINMEHCNWVTLLTTRGHLPTNVNQELELAVKESQRSDMVKLGTSRVIKKKKNQMLSH